jgi:hypothetical protein
MAKRALGHQRTINFTTRWSPHEYKLLVSRRKEAGAKTDSAYLRAAALYGPKFEANDWSGQRHQTNAVINLARVLETLPPTKLRDEALVEAKATLRRMCRS